MCRTDGQILLPFMRNPRRHADAGFFLLTLPRQAFRSRQRYALRQEPTGQSRGLQPTNLLRLRSKGDIESLWLRSGCL